MIMKAISLWQPWASLWACGAKKNETRSWATSYRGPIAIHAAMKPINTGSYLDRELHRFAEALGLPDIYSFDTLPYGCIIATAEFVGCHLMTEQLIANQTKLERLFGDWRPGRYAWEIINIKLLDEPVPVKGRQGLWNWEAA